VFPTRYAEETKLGAGQVAFQSGPAVHTCFGLVVVGGQDLGMPVDADIAVMLAAAKAAGGTPEQARANYLRAPKPAGDTLARAEDHVIPGPTGDIAIRIYAGSDSTDLPVIAFFHGGGWVRLHVLAH